MRKLGKHIKEYSLRNKKLQCDKVFSVTNSKGFIPSIDYFSKEVFSKNLSNYKIVKKGMVAFNPSRINVGSIANLETEDEVVISPLYIVFETDDTLDSKFLTYFLKSNLGNQQIRNLTSGSVRDSLKYSALEKISIPGISINQQKELVIQLDKIKKIICLKKDQLQQLDNLIKSRFVEMFGDPISNSKGLAEYTLSEIGEFGRGVSKHRPRNASELLGGKYPLIQTGDVANTNLYITKYERTYSELGYKQSKMWDKGTLCITIAANIAKTAILSFDACFPDSVVGFCANKKTNNIYIHFWFSFFQSILEAQAPESAQKNINLRILSELKVIIPPIEEQSAFVNFVKQVDKLKVEVKFAG